MKSIVLIFLFFNCTGLFSQSVLKPFPQHSEYYKGVIIPNHISQKKLDESVSSFYNQWKSKYLRKSDCDNTYYIWAENTGKSNQCVSEGQGYGMIIVCMMAGYDKEAQQIFDGLFKYYKEHPSQRSKYLMSWVQKNVCDKIQETSASDGDIDIAFSLILANTQWTSKGNINYKAEAFNIIKAIREQEINSKTFSILQNNSIESDSKDFNDMRSSDFIPSEIRIFQFIDSSLVWTKVLDNNYSLFRILQKKYSNDAGLIPDFIRNINHNPIPAKGFYLESKYDGYYNYNACRIPWRIATDYILNGELRAKQIVEPINTWIKQTTENNPDNISAGYKLSGDDLKSRNFEALSFISSFSIAAMVDKKNQEWLNSLWDYIINFKLIDFDYYDNSIKLLNLLILSKNYWAK